jgi:hypothetical protein
VPSPNHVRAIYFFEAGSNPLFLWVRIINPPSSDDSTPLGPHLGAQLSIPLNVHTSNLGNSAECKATLREFKRLSWIKLQDGLIQAFIWVGSFIDDKATGITQNMGKNNTSVAAIDPELSDVLFGPILFYAPNRCLDTVDFHHLVD